MNSNLMQFSCCILTVVVVQLPQSCLNLISHLFFPLALVLNESLVQNVFFLCSYATLNSTLVEELFFSFYCNPLVASHQQYHMQILYRMWNVINAADFQFNAKAMLSIPVIGWFLFHWSSWWWSNLLTGCMKLLHTFFSLLVLWWHRYIWGFFT